MAATSPFWGPHEEVTEVYTDTNASVTETPSFCFLDHSGHRFDSGCWVQVVTVMGLSAIKGEFPFDPGSEIPRSQPGQSGCQTHSKERDRVVEG